MNKISKRHVAKSISWRVIGTLDTLLFAWLITGDLNYGLSVSFITTITKLVWYYMHEQLWFNSSIRNSNKRHIIKTFTWRIIGTLDTIIFVLLIIGNPLIGLKIGVLETASKMLLYYGHEKLWYKIKYGLNHNVKLNRKNKLVNKSN